MKINQLLIGAILAIGLASCGSDDEATQKFTVAYNANYAYVTDNNTGQSSLNAPVTIDFTFDVATLQMSAKFYNLQLTGGEVASFEIPSRQYKSVNGAFVLEIPEVTVGAGNNARKLSNVYISYLAGQYAWSEPAEIIDIKFDIDQYSVTVLEEKRYFGGNTDVITPGSADVFSSTTMVYEVCIDPVKNPDGSRKSNINIYNAQFAPQMPTLTKITLPGVSLYPHQGGYRLSADEVTPLLDNGAPAPQFVITDIDGDWNIGQKLNLRFSAMHRYDVEATLN